jgi:hypothetical protein
MLKTALVTLLLIASPVVSAFADNNARLAVLRENAELFGFVSAGADYCENLTLADIPEVKRAIEVLSSSQLVGPDFEKTNAMTIDGILRDREGSCAMLARNFHWFYRETRR